jgi:biotin carboxylase
MEPGLNNLPELELSRRLSFSWLLDDMPERKTIALVHGRDTVEAAQPILETTRDLGIDLIILDRPNHWLLDEQYVHLYASFEAIDMTVDEGFAQRIVTAVRRYKVHGICTVSDRCLLPTSTAAFMMGLPTELPAAFARSIDKSQTCLLNRHHVDFVSIRQVNELQDALSTHFHPTYPLIVKPSIGWSSEHVFKVRNEAELLLAARKVASRPNTKILVESYIDGPEVDANFVLCDGKVVFFEISDDFPCPADDVQAGVEADFFETANVLPSALPQEEQVMLRNQLHQILLQVGFRTGVFHLEARVIDSSLKYEYEDGTLDLRSKLEGQRNCPRCFLIEINPRPPGFQSVYATRIAYGVDYFALHLLHCINDLQRFRVFAQSFNERIDRGRSGDYWCSIVFITNRKGGICNTVNGYDDMIKRKPYLERNIAMGMSFFKKGDEIPDCTNERLVFLGFFLVSSRISRSKVRLVGDEIKREFRLQIR